MELRKWIDIKFILHEAGWASLEIQTDASNHRIDGISYLGNALEDLLRSGVMLAIDGEPSVTYLMHEPGVTKLAAIGFWLDGDRTDWGCRFEATYFPDKFMEKPEDGGENVFVEVFRNSDTVAKALLRAGDDVLEKHGVENYLNLWITSPFPLRALEALRAALAVERLPGRDWD